MTMNKDICECGEPKNKRAKTCRGCWAPHNKSLLPIIEELISSRESGLTLKELEKKYNVCRKTLSLLLREAGIDLTNRGSWKGGRRTDSQGYVQVYLDKNNQLAVMRNSGGYVPEHRLVYAQGIGRPLTQPEEVHHKNGVKDDNKFDNLELWSTSQPAGQRVTDKVAWAKELIRTYEPDYEAEEWW